MTAGRERRIRDAEQQVEDERWQCRTCADPAEESGEHCLACRMYWEDARGEYEDRMLRNLPLLAIADHG